MWVENGIDLDYLFYSMKAKFKEYKVITSNTKLVGETRI